MSHARGDSRKPFAELSRRNPMRKQSYVDKISSHWGRSVQDYVPASICPRINRGVGYKPKIGEQVDLEDDPRNWGENLLYQLQLLSQLTSRQPANAKQLLLKKVRDRQSGMGGHTRQIAELMAKDVENVILELQSSTSRADERTHSESALNRSATIISLQGADSDSDSEAATITFQPVTDTPDVSIVAEATEGFIVQPAPDTLAASLVAESMDEQSHRSTPCADNDDSFAIRIRILEQKAVVSRPKLTQRSMKQPQRSTRLTPSRSRLKQTSSSCSKQDASSVPVVATLGWQGVGWYLAGVADSSAS